MARVDGDLRLREAAAELGRRPRPGAISDTRTMTSRVVRPPVRFGYVTSRRSRCSSGCPGSASPASNPCPREPVARLLELLGVAPTLVVPDPDGDVEVPVLEQALVVEVVLLGGAGRRGGLVELAERAGGQVPRGHAAPAPEEVDGLAGLVAEASVLAVADHLEADGDQGLLDGGHGRPVVGAREGALPGRDPREARQAGEARVGERDGLVLPDIRVGRQLRSGAAARRLDRVRIWRELLGATLTLHRALGDRGGGTVAGSPLESDREAPEGPAVESVDGRRCEARVRRGVAPDRPRGVAVPVDRGPLASIDSTCEPSGGR